LGGKMTVESDGVDCGSNICFRLPYRID